MDIGGRILETLRTRGALSGAQIATVLGMSRQAAHGHLVCLMDKGLLSRIGRMRGVEYRLPDRRGGSKTPAPEPFRKKHQIDGLMEDAMLADVVLHLALRRSVSPAAYRIFTYAFTAMLNNAIEHSHSPTCTAEVTLA